MSLFICPKCKERLILDNNSIKCLNNHCYDIAKEGYVNLLLSSSSSHGDDCKMVASRRNFLSGGYYSKLCQNIADTINRYYKSGNYILDAGCGEGYYTSAICDATQKEYVYGIDVSKNAIKYASKKIKNNNFAVASVYELPFASNSFNFVTSIFSPFALDEFIRILKKDGIVINVFPLERHLFELKKEIYNVPYENQVDNIEIDGFDLLSYDKVEYEISLESNDVIKDLFSMTPYYYRTNKDGLDRLNALNCINTHVGFGIASYRKK